MMLLLIFLIGLNVLAWRCAVHYALLQPEKLAAGRSLVWLQGGNAIIKRYYHVIESGLMINSWHVFISQPCCVARDDLPSPFNYSACFCASFFFFFFLHWIRFPSSAALERDSLRLAPCSTRRIVNIHSWSSWR